VEETSAAARNLTGEVTTLAEQATRFTIGNDRAPDARMAPPKKAGKTSHRSPVKALPAAVMANGAGSEEWAAF
jgi:methyl-accepting chemotaxis protein